MSDAFIYIFVILLIAVIGIMIYTLSQIKKIKEDDGTSQIDKQLGAILMLMKQNSGNSAEEFERRRGSLTLPLRRCRRAMKRSLTR